MRIWWVAILRFGLEGLGPDFIFCFCLIFICTICLYLIVILLSVSYCTQNATAACIYERLLVLVPHRLCNIMVLRILSKRYGQAFSQSKLHSAFNLVQSVRQSKIHHYEIVKLDECPTKGVMFPMRGLLSPK